MLDALRKLYRSAVAVDAETRKVLELVGEATRQMSSCRILDVGCGYGRYLRLLHEAGFHVTGVDANAEVIAANRHAGLRCLTTDELASTREEYDVLVMSHVIEHFSPNELLRFMDTYLDRLKPSGHVVLATPLLSSNFYDDFDHVRPYQPIGLLMVFSDRTAQVQYYARNRLQLQDIWFRRSPWRPSHVRARHIRSPMTRVVQLVELLAALAFRLTGGLLGRTDGWVGLFQKIGTVASDRAASPS